MKNNVIFAAAGNGKTYNICKEAKELAEKTKKYVLITSYTHEGVHAIETEYKKQNLGVIDNNVIIKTWYSFLLSELIKPYQCFLDVKYKDYKREIDFKVPENYISSIAFYQDGPLPRYFTSNHIQYYLNSAHDIRKDNVSNLACLCIKHSKNKVIERLENIYENIFFDELQDYAGYDLNIFVYLFKSNICVTCVGDYKQATFRTNNSRMNSKYRDENIKDFFILQGKNQLCDIHYDKTTRRFNREICNFVNIIHNDDDNMILPREDCVEHDNAGVFIITSNDIVEYCKYYNPTILRYNVKSKINFDHNCHVLNYGSSKGATYDRVVIVPVSTAIPFIKNKIPISSKTTKSKFFVACTRAKHSVVFLLDDCSDLINFKQTTLKLGEYSITAYKYIG